MVARTCIYLYIQSLLGLCWCIEQPASSLLEKHVVFQWLCRQITVYRAPWLKLVSKRFEAQCDPKFTFNPSMGVSRFASLNLTATIRYLYGLEAMAMTATWTPDGNTSSG